MGQLPKIPDTDWAGARSVVRRGFQKIESTLFGKSAEVTHAEMTLTGLTASRLVATDSSKMLASVSDLASWITGTANEINIANDGDGTITIGIVDPLIVGKGGTGIATLTNHGILLGSGTGAITPLAAAADGQLPIGSTGADPVLATLTGTANQVAIANAAGSITLSTPQDIHTGASPTFADLTISTPVNIYALSHDSFADFVANEHINHTGVTLTAGTGLTGGGDISANRTFAVDGVLEDLDTLGAAASDGQFIVATGVGGFAYESGATARTSLGLGTTNTPTFTGLIVADAGYIGSVSDTDAIQIEADGDVVFSQKVSIGGTNPGRSFEVIGGEGSEFLFERSDLPANQKRWNVFMQPQGDPVHGAVYFRVLNDAGTAGWCWLGARHDNWNVGIGKQDFGPASAHCHISAGIAAAEGAPLKFNSGTNLTTPEAGAMEFDGTNLYFTPAAARKTVVLTDSSPAFAGATIGSLSGIVLATAGVLSAITNNSAHWDTAYSHSQLGSGNPHSVTPTELGLVIGTNVQAYDAALTSISGLTYASASFIKMSAEDTYVVRTIAETKSDLSLNLVENTALSTWAGTTNITTLGAITGELVANNGISLQETLTGLDSYTKLLLHMDGANASVVFTDSSFSGLTITPVFDAQISTAQSKFGGSSALFDGTGDYLTGTLDTAFGTGDFTIDCWVQFSSLYNYISIFSTPRGPTGFNVGTQAVGALVWYSSSKEQLRSDNGVIEVDTMYHVAYVRSGTTLTGYLNGVAFDSATVSTDFSAAEFLVGAQGGSEYITGYIDELRVSIGVARWTANFTPPTKAYGDGVYGRLNVSNHYEVDGVQVVGNRGAAVADATGADDVVDQLNALLAECRTHGLIAAA